MATPRTVDRRALVGAVVLILVGAWLIFGGDDGTGSEDSASTAGTQAPTGTDAERGGDDQDDDDSGNTPSDSAEPTPSRLPDDGRPSPEPTGTSTPKPSDSPEAPDGHEGENDAHGFQDPPTKEEVERAPKPEFSHEFRTDVPEEAAREIIRVAWKWLVPTLEERGWSHLELLEYGVLGTRGDENGNLWVARAEIGYSGAYALGNVRMGKVVSVWVKKRDGDTWSVTGFRASEFGPSESERR